MSKPVYFVVYVSSSVDLMSSEDIRFLLSICHINNTKLNITGMLLHRDGNFMQMIEGDEAAVRALLEKISRDPRHKNIITLIDGNTEERQFPDWSMAFRELNSPDIKSLPGFNEFLNTPLTDKEFESRPSVAQRLLLSFKKNSR